ncbi:type II secretion system protein [Alicyclobacillus fastidiosus]|uniref:Prepilin-type N-terminal cleavage/methylation domain-containing protein n=1 Tax=Alicyclobacillus fastidiosus TaxID=392011 RepID=A0ABV5AFS2_9BACL|nr:prepilin-type N-terminal cleavage/methylation domain-containing protein [Alicyclobacillus fastidiosus]WEH11692.1 prepilin-type N-terminal cleavage/methylation domain-containing protein [Alicyclobacillus fastidiosus]
MAREDHRSPCRGHAFTLIETLIAVTVTAIAFAMVLPAVTEVKRAADLDASALALVSRLREAQSLGATSSQAGTLWLDPADSRYHLTQGTTTTGTYAFAPDVHYVDGYLQLPNRRISYDNLGNAQVAGKIRLTDGVLVRVIALFMGTGLQQASWLTS